jgi:dynein assembly factor 2
MTDRLKMKIEDMDITPDELNRFTEAFKKEEFRKLFAEYAEEISNPENRRIYEKELEQLENERGVDVTFIHPEPGFVIKTTQNGDQKCFINICKNVNVQKPKSDVTNEKQTDGSTRKGITWSIPHSCAPPKEDLDKSGKRCVVYDVVFHPDSYRMGETNQRFKDLLKDTACETIEKNFNAKLDRENMKILKMPFKGTPTATVVRRPKSNTDTKFNPKDETDPLNGIKTPYSYPPTQPLIREQKTDVVDDDKRPIAKQVEIKRENTDVETRFTVPKYTIINRGQSDLQDCVNDRQHTHVGSLRPKEICIEIDLPLCKNVSNVKLDIYEKHLHLESQKPYYRLDIDLPYPVNENDGNAKFDKAKKMLSVTLPVLPFYQNIDERRLPVDDQANTQSILTSHDKSSEVQVTSPVSEGSDSASSQQHLTNSTNDELSDNKPIINEINPISNELQKPTTNGINQHVKYNLPEKYILKQNSKMFKLIFCAINIDSKSFDVTFDPSRIFIKYECIGSGGYATHSSIYIKFQKDFIRSQQAPAPTNHQSEMMEICFEKLDKYCIIEKADVALNPYDSNITVCLSFFFFMKFNVILIYVEVY